MMPFASYLCDEAVVEKLDYAAARIRFAIIYPEHPAKFPPYSLFIECYDELAKRGILVASDEYKKFRVMAELERK